MQKSSSLSSSVLLLLSLLLLNLFQFTYSLCWEQAFVNNTVFINTVTTGHVQMGHISQINKLNFPNYNIIPSGMPKITAQLLKEKCDKLSVKICAAVQFFQVPGTFGVEQLSLDWGNFLTLQEYRSTRKQGTVLPPGEEVTGIAYKRIRCPRTPLNGDPSHTNFNLIHPINVGMLSYFGFSSVLLNYIHSFFHNNNDNNNEEEYLSDVEQEEEDLFFNQLEEEEG